MYCRRGKIKIPKQLVQYKLSFKARNFTITGVLSNKGKGMSGTYTVFRDRANNFVTSTGCVAIIVMKIYPGTFYNIKLKKCFCYLDNMKLHI